MNTTETTINQAQFTKQLLGFLHRGGSAAYYWGVAQDETKHTYWHPPGQNGVVPKAFHTYFGVHPCRAVKDVFQRATKEGKDVCAVNCLFAEFDAKDRPYLNPTEQAEYDRIKAAHAEAVEKWTAACKDWKDAGKPGKKPIKPEAEKLVFDLDAAKVRALAHIRSLPMQPSVVVDSGGGYHCFWYLTETFALATDENRDYITQLQAVWVEAVGGDMAAKDLERVLRVPGTLNNKYSPPRPVVVIDAPETRYALSELEAWAVGQMLAKPAAPVLPPPAPPKDSNTTKKSDTPTDNTDVIGKFNAAKKLADIITEHHYEITHNGTRFRRAGKDKGGSGYFSGDTLFSFSGSGDDPLCNGHQVNAFGAFCILEHAGDVKAAVKDAAKQLGLAALKPDAERKREAVGENGLPNIQTNNREPRDVSDDCIKALAQQGETFVRAGGLVRVVTDEKSRVGIENITVDILCAKLTRAANFYTVQITPKGKFINAVAALPVRVATDILSIGHWPQFPALEAVIESPTMRPNGSILSVAGYDKETKLFYKPPPGFKFPDIPENPDAEDVAAALMLLREIVWDFPFEDDASRDNAIAAILTPIVRPMITKNVPLVMADAPQQSTGKTLFAQAIGGLATGEMPEASPAPSSHEEWRKCITAHLSGGRAVIVLDNITATIEDGALAAVLTSTSWSDRLLGRNDKVIRLPALACWIATGNNLTVGGDLATRCYLIRLDAKMSRPEERDSQEFKHPDLEHWIKINRGMLLGAALTLARAWHLAGRPKPDCPRFRLEEWRNVVGGILCFAGVKHFLGNIRQFRDAADSDGPVWEAFIGKLAEVFPGQAVTPGMIYSRLVASEEMASYLPDELLSELGDPENPKHKNKFSQSLAFAFRARAGKHHGDTQARVQKAKSTTGGQFWSFYVK